MTTSGPEPDFTSDDLTGGFPGDEEEKVAEVGEGVQQPGEAEKEEEVLEQQQQQKQQEQQQQQQPQQAVGESQCESECEPKEEKEEECHPNTAQPEETTIPKGLDDNSAEDRKLFVGGLSWETKEAQLKEYFDKFGEIESVNLKLDPVTGRSRCFAFLVFKEKESVEKVLGGGGDHAINSKKVDVKRAKAKPGKIFVGGLVPELEDEQIKTYFAQFGNVTDCEMPFDKTKNQRKNFCFVTFEREETMKELLKSPKQKIGEVEVDVKRATPKSGYRGGGGGYGGDFYGYTDYYYGYPDYYGWAGKQQGSGGGKMGAGSRGTARTNPY